MRALREPALLGRFAQEDDAMHEDEKPCEFCGKVGFHSLDCELEIARVREIEDLTKEFVEKQNKKIVECPIATALRENPQLLER